MFDKEINDDAVIIALGSNLKGAFASSQVLLGAALDRLPDFGMIVLRCSSWWRSAAWPMGHGPDFLNGVVIVRTELAADRLLLCLLAVETLFGRQRGGANDPRTLDLDLIAHGRLVVTTRDLALPHPRAASRFFVMAPLAQVAPDWRHPVLGESATALAARAEIGRDAKALRVSNTALGA